MSRRKPHRGPSGVLIIDKPGGITSHDVVSRVRKRLNVRRVGHAGTLDPMATGVLVVMVGEATKLAPFLTVDDKSYDADVQLGVATDSLDAEGSIVQSAPLPEWFADELERTRRVNQALELERARTRQSPPAYSAIKVEGRAAHARMRAGENVELADRPVAVRELLLEATDPRGVLRLTMRVSKGYYVRALARDLGRALGLPAHLTGLRRSASGAFDIEQAIALDAAEPHDLILLSDAARRALPVAVLGADGCTRAGHGGPIRRDDFLTPPPAAGPCAWLDETDRLVAVGGVRDDKYVVLRGFPPQPS